MENQSKGHQKNTAVRVVLRGLVFAVPYGILRALFLDHDETLGEHIRHAALTAALFTMVYEWIRRVKSRQSEGKA